MAMRVLLLQFGLMLAFAGCGMVALVTPQRQGEPQQMRRILSKATEKLSVLDTLPD
jgi:hypothetical protein